MRIYRCDRCDLEKFDKEIRKVRLYISDPTYKKEDISYEKHYCLSCLKAKGLTPISPILRFVRQLLKIK